MSQVLRRRVMGILASILLALALLEVTLALADPLGVRYLYQLVFMADYYTGPLDAYQLAPGTYDMGNWAATVKADQTRLVPNSGAGCTLALFGDSVTWGWGVDDADTFANQLARPGWAVVNAGQNGYNATQVQGAIERTAFDAGVYLLIHNDASRPLNYGGRTPQPGAHQFPGFGVIHGQLSALRAYYVYLVTRFGRGDVDMEYPDYPAYWAALDAIAARGDVQIVAFDEPYGRDAAARYPVHLIPKYTSTVSLADSHPDRAGHTQTADSLRPIIEPITC